MKTDSNGLSKILLEAEILESEFEINAQRSHPPRLDKSSNVFNAVSHANEDTGNHYLGYAGNHNIKDTGNHGVEDTGNNAGNHDIQVAGNHIVQEAPVSSASLETSGVDSKSEELLVLSPGSSGVHISGETFLGSTKTAKTKLDELEQFMKETLASESTKIFENTPHIEGKNCLEIPKTLNRDKNDTAGRIYRKKSQIEQNPSVQTPELYPSQDYVKNQEMIVERNLIVNPMQLLNRPPRLVKYFCYLNLGVSKTLKFKVISDSFVSNAYLSISIILGGCSFSEGGNGALERLLETGVQLWYIFTHVLFLGLDCQGIRED